MKNILFYGNFGKDGDIATNGQTSKTISFYKITRRLFPEASFSIFNTALFKKSPLLSFLKLKKMVKKAGIIILFPGSINSLKMIEFVSRKTDSCFFYPVVGGWIADRIKNKPRLVSFLRRFEGIYPETTGLKNKLSDLKIINNVTDNFVIIFPFGCQNRRPIY